MIQFEPLFTVAAVSDLLLATVLSAFILSTVYDRVTGDGPSDLDARAEAAQQAFVDGEISHAELARRLEVTECPETTKIRRAVEPVPGIADEISYAIAEHYDSLAELRQASVADLQSVPRVGHAKATAIADRLWEGDRDD